MERFCGVRALCIRWLAEIFIAFSNARYRRCHCGKSTCSRPRFFFFSLSLPFSFLFPFLVDIQLLAIVALSKVFDAAFFFFFLIVSILFLGLVLFFFFNFVVLVATSINRPCVERAIDGFGDQGSKVFQVYFIFFFFFLEEEKNVILVLVYSISEKDKIKLAEQRDCILRRLLYQEKEATTTSLFVDSFRCESLAKIWKIRGKFRR